MHQKILCVSYYFSTDRILLYTQFLENLADSFDLSVWSFAVKEKNFPVSNANAKYFELLKGKDSVPQWLNLVRHFADYVWDHKGLSRSRETMWRYRKFGSTNIYEKALWKAAKLTNTLRKASNFDRPVEQLMLRHGYCDESLKFFEADKPAAVIAMVPFTPLHMSIVASARKLGIPVIAYITSWDNITTKPRLTFEYDGYLVWSETMKKELIEFHPQSKNKPIHIVGAPQYDIMFDERFYETKEEFLRRYGLSSNKRTILYCLGSPNFIQEDHGVAAFLDGIDRKIGDETQIVIRLHPGFYEHDYKVIPELRRKHKNIVFQGNRKYFDKHPLQPEDSIIDWVNTFRHVDVVINLASTVTVDAAIFDKPIININFDSQPGSPDQQLVEEINATWNHFSPIVRSGGVWNVNSNAEMMDAIKGYLKDPSLHREGRRQIVEYVCGTLDGRSGERMANSVSSILSEREVGCVRGKSVATNKRPLVHMYMQDWLPATGGTGTNNRLFSNLRAYLDLGYEVEVVCFRRKCNFEFGPIEELENVQWTFIKPHLSNGLFDRISYLTNFSEDRALNYRFKSRMAIRNEVETRIRQNPKSLHHFEYLDTACSYISLPKCRAIWSMHDLESKFANAQKQIRSELSNGKKYGWEARAAKFLALAEKKAAQESALTLCIAKHEKDFLRDKWNCPQAEFFPMSLPDESVPPRKTKPGSDSKFSILHLGRVDSLPSYRSLEFLLTQVFPLLSPEMSEKIEFLIVGELRNSPKAIRIKEMAAGYSFVKFVGFQKDLRKQYSRADLQVVGSTAATGLRTRIIESFAYNVPVLSTTVGAEGVHGLVNGRNILLADTPEHFRSSLEKMLVEPEFRNKIARGGRILYDQIYSRAAVSKQLAELLSTYSLAPA